MGDNLLRKHCVFVEAGAVRRLENGFFSCAKVNVKVLALSDQNFAAEWLYSSIEIVCYSDDYRITD
jgi:hypothetical protein